MRDSRSCGGSGGDSVWARLRGILDATHTRLFTFGSMRRALRDGAFDIEKTVGIPAPIPLAIGRNRLASLLLRVNQILIRLSRSLFAYQMLMVCRPTPALDWLLQDAVTESLERSARMKPAHAGMGTGSTAEAG